MKDMIKTHYVTMSLRHLVLMTLAAAFCGCGAKEPSDIVAEGAKRFEAGDTVKAEKLFKEALAKDAANVDALVYLTRIALDEGEIEAANEMIGRARELAGKDSDVLLLSGQTAYHLKDYQLAKQCFREVVENMKNAAETRGMGWTGLGICHSACEEMHLARAAYLTALRVSPREASAWYHLGLLYRDGFGYYEAALSQLDCYVRLEAIASPRVQKAQLKLIPALKDTIARTLTERKGVQSRDPSACQKELLAADAAFKRGEFKKARGGYEAALGKDGLSYPAALGAAKASLKSDGSQAGQRKALEYYKLACILKPSSASTFLTAGELAVKLGNQAMAQELYSRAVAANPVSTDAIDGLIRALQKIGDKKSAQAYQSYRDILKAPRKK